MQLSLQKPPCFAARPTATRPSRRAGPVKPRAAAALDSRDDGDASGVLSGEWAPTWSLGLSALRPGGSRNATIARGTANDDGAADPSGILSGEWAAESEWALTAYEDVRRIYKERRASKNGSSPRR